MNISTWLKPFLQKHTQLGTAIKGLASFFKTDSLVGRQRGEVIAAQNALINKNNANKKRKRVDVMMEDEEGGRSSTEHIQKSIADAYKGGGIENKAPSGSIYDESSSGITFNKEAASSFEDGEFRKPLPPPALGILRVQGKGMPKKQIKIVKGLPKSGPKVLKTVSNMAALSSSSGLNYFRD